MLKSPRARELCIAIKSGRGEIRYLAFAPRCVLDFPINPRRRTVLNPVYDRAAKTGRRLREKPEKRKAPGQRRETKSRMRTACLCAYVYPKVILITSRRIRRYNTIGRAFSLTITAKGESMRGSITVIISPIRRIRWKQERELREVSA